MKRNGKLITKREHLIYTSFNQQAKLCFRKTPDSTWPNTPQFCYFKNNVAFYDTNAPQIPSLMLSLLASLLYVLEGLGTELHLDRNPTLPYFLRKFTPLLLSDYY